MVSGHPLTKNMDDFCKFTFWPEAASYVTKISFRACRYWPKYWLLIGWLQNSCGHTHIELYVLEILGIAKLLIAKKIPCILAWPSRSNLQNVHSCNDEILKFNFDGLAGVARAHTPSTINFDVHSPNWADDRPTCSPSAMWAVDLGHDPSWSVVNPV